MNEKWKIKLDKNYALSEMENRLLCSAIIPKIYDKYIEDNKQLRIRGRGIR